MSAFSFLKQSTTQNENCLFKLSSFSQTLYMYVFTHSQSFSDAQRSRIFRSSSQETLFSLSFLQAGLALTTVRTEVQKQEADICLTEANVLDFKGGLDVQTGIIDGAVSVLIMLEGGRVG